MAINVSVSDAKARLSGYIEQAAESDEAVVIESHGTPKAVLIPYKAYQQFIICRPSEFAATQLPRLFGSHPDSPNR